MILEGRDEVGRVVLLVAEHGDLRLGAGEARGRCVNCIGMIPNPPFCQLSMIISCPPAKPFCISPSGSGKKQDLSDRLRLELAVS